MTNIEQKLKEAGLHRSEITVYLYLLEQGLSSPPQIAKGTKIARTNCYNILKSLKEKDLIEEQQKNKHKVYLACDPDAILESLERKKRAVEQILPDLRGIFTVQKNKPKIRFYDGLEQLKKLYEETLSAKKIMAIGSVKKLNDILPEFFVWYAKQLKKHQVAFYDLQAETSRTVSSQIQQKYQGELYTVKFFPPNNPDISTDMLIWDDNIALLTLEEPYFGTIITNAAISKTFNTIFETMWQGLR